MLHHRYRTTYSSPLGGLTLCSNGDSITGLWFDGQKYYPNFLEQTEICNSLPIFVHAKYWLDDYFSNKRPPMNLPLSLDGSPFRQAVWRIILHIPYGELMTYGQIAQKLKIPSAQAVGGAVAHNPASIFVPCHRIVGTNGSLTGYAGGLEKKIALLHLEGIPVDHSRLRILRSASFPHNEAP